MALRLKNGFYLSVLALMHLYGPRLLDDSGVNRQWLGWLLSLIIFFCLPVTSGAAGVLDRRYFVPGDVLCRPHYPLESFAVEGGAVAVPGGDRMLSNCASVKV
jgi:hypothetical protein